MRLITSMFIELAATNQACGFLIWSLIPTQAGLANTRTVGYLGGSQVRYTCVCVVVFFFGGGILIFAFFVVNCPTPHRIKPREQPPILVFVWLCFLVFFFGGGVLYSLCLCFVCFGFQVLLHLRPSLSNPLWVCQQAQPQRGSGTIKGSSMHNQNILAQ